MRLFNKISKIFVLTVCLVLSLSFFTSSMVDKDILKNNLIAIINKSLEGNFMIRGNVETSFFPKVKITANNVILTNVVYKKNLISVNIKKVVAHSDYLSLLFGKLEINNLDLISPTLQIDFLDSNLLKEIPRKDILLGSESRYNKGRLKREAEVLNKNTAENSDETRIELSEIKKITPKNLELKKFDKNKFTYDDSNFLSKILSPDKNSDMLDIKKIKQINVLDGNLNKRGIDGEIILDTRNINFTSKNKKDLVIKGNMLVNKTPTYFDLSLDIKKNKNSKLTLNSPIFNFTVSGKFFESDFKDLLRSSFQGKLVANIINPKEFFNKYFSKYILIYGRVSSTSNIRINANINSLKGNYKISNIKTESQDINAKGYINANLETKNAVIESKIDVKNINLDSLWATRFVNHSSIVVDFEKNLINSFKNQKKAGVNKSIILKNYQDYNTSNKKKVFKTIELNSEIKIKKARYLNDYLSDIEVFVNMSKDGDIQVDKATMIIPDGGLLSVSGVFKNQFNLSSFVGKYDVKGKSFSKLLSWINLNHKTLKKVKDMNYNASGEVMVLSNFMTLKNFKIDLDGGKNLINGDISFDSSKQPQKMESNISIGEFNFSDYFNIDFKKSRYLLPGSLVNKLVWLNTVIGNNNIKLKIKNFKYKDTNFLNQELSMRIAPGIVRINNLKIKPENSKINSDLSIYIDLRSKPKIELDLTVNNFDYLISRAKASVINSNLSSRFFLLPSISDFNGSVNLKLNQSSINNIKIDKLKLIGKIKNGLIKIKDAKANIARGDTEYNGEIFLGKDKSVSGNFVISKANNKNLLSNIFNINNIKGILNASGRFNFSANNYKEFFDSFRAKVNFKGGGVVVENFGLNELLKRTLLINNQDVDLKNVNNILFSKDYSTSFRDVTGSYEIDKTKSLSYFYVNSKATGINTITDGSLDLFSNSINALSKIVILSGKKSRSVPINIAINYSGDLKDLKKIPNLQHVEQYIRKFKRNK